MVKVFTLRHTVMIQRSGSERKEGRKEGWKEERKDGRKKGRMEGRKEGWYQLMEWWEGRMEESVGPCRIGVARREGKVSVVKVYSSWRCIILYHTYNTIHTFISLFVNHVSLLLLLLLLLLLCKCSQHQK